MTETRVGRNAVYKTFLFNQYVQCFLGYTFTLAGYHCIKHFFNFFLGPTSETSIFLKERYS